MKNKFEKKKILTLNLKKEYFLEILNGKKKYEYRVRNNYWIKRLENKNFDEIHFKLGYPKKGDEDKTIIKPYIGYELQVISHKLFGEDNIEVFAIKIL